MDQFDNAPNPFQSPTTPPLPPGETALDKEARTWAMLCHLLALTGFATVIGFVVGPLIAWVVKKDQYTFVDEHGKESLNFQISVLIYTIAVGAIISLTCGVGLVLLPILIVLPIADLILVIMAALKASNGEMYRYPLTIRLLK